MESEKLLSGRVSSESSFEELDLGHQVRTRRSRRARVGKWALRLLVSWLTIWSIFNISTKLWKTSHKPQRVSCACGSSFAEARSLNCRFDSLASAWLRPECIDEDLTAEFNRAGPGPDGSWTYYTDYAKTGTYTLDQIASLADTGIFYYNTQEWHLAHCTYNWRKAVRSKWTGVVMEARSDTEEHVNHCEAMFKSRLPLDYVGVVSAITFDADWAGLKHEMHEMHAMHDMHDMHDMHTMHEEDSKSMHNMHDGNMHQMHEDSKSMHGDMHGEMHGEMHPEGSMHKSMHSDEMRPEEQMHPSLDMHPSENMHPSSDMHPSTAMHPSENMHPSMEMHPSEKMHPSTDMRPDMHPNMHPSENMHPSAEMHPSTNMHPSNMHPSENMHPSSDMHPSSNMHPSVAMHPSEEMHPSADMHPGNMHPSADMHPTELA